jgi:hypothetical protein
MSARIASVKVAQKATRCPYCHDDIPEAASEVGECRACGARHHGDCWFDGGGCSVCGAVHGIAQLPAEDAPRAPTGGGFLGWLEASVEVAVALLLIGSFFAALLSLGTLPGPGEILLIFSIQGGMAAALLVRARSAAAGRD